MTDEERRLIADWGRMYPSVRAQLRKHGPESLGPAARQAIAQADAGAARLRAQGAAPWWAERMRERWKLGLDDD